MVIKTEIANQVQLKEIEPIDQPTTYTIYFEWTISRPDPTSYKQLAPEFHPMGLQVAIDVPVKYFLSYDQDSHSGVLTAEGMAYASRQINMAISKIMSKEI